MSVKEIYDNLAEDLKKIEYQRKKLLPKAIKQLKKKTSFPAWEIYEYTVPSTNNTYFINYYAQSIRNCNDPVVTSLCLASDRNETYMLEWGGVLYKHAETRPLDFVRQVRFYSSHFIDRYIERFLKDDTLTHNDAICIYVSRNQDFIPLKVNEGININYKKYGNAGANAFRVRDGICFLRGYVYGEESKDGDINKDVIDSIGIVFKTFVDSCTLHESQKQAIDEEHEHCLTDSINYLKEEFDRANSDLIYTLPK